MAVKPANPTKPDPNFEVSLKQASLFIRKVKANPCMLLGHTKALEKSYAKYPIDRVLCKAYSISPGSGYFKQGNVLL